MRFFVDEDLSPALVGECHRAGYDATSNRDRGMLGASDREVARLCLEEERVLVTNNASDFIRLAEVSGLHPGLVVMPLGSRSRESAWMMAAIAHIDSISRAGKSEAGQVMINRVVEVDEMGIVEDFEHPSVSEPGAGYR